MIAVFAADVWGIALTLAAFVAVMVAGTLVLRRRRQDVWRAFARRHGLQYRIDDGRPRVMGTLDGRRVELSIVGESSDTGPMGVEVIRLAMSLAAPPPVGLKLESAGGVVGDVQKTMNEDRFETGDEEFDRQVNVSLTDAPSATEWLTPTRRRAFLDLVRENPADLYTIAAGQLQWQCRTALGDADKLDVQLRHLAIAAAAMDGGGR